MTGRALRLVWLLPSRGVVALNDIVEADHANDFLNDIAGLRRHDAMMARLQSRPVSHRKNQAFRGCCAVRHALHQCRPARRQ